MELKEIYQGLVNHALTGVMMHTELAQYFDFLNLHGYKKMSTYHAKMEMANLNKMKAYYLNHYNRLIKEQYEDPNVIPEGWFEHVRQDVDINTKRQAVRDGFTKWRDWERDTKKYYSDMYKELCEIGEVASAMKISECVECVDKELKWVERKLLELQAADYSMEFIMDEQQFYHQFYKKKMSEKCL